MWQVDSRDVNIKDPSSVRRLYHKIKDKAKSTRKAAVQARDESGSPEQVRSARSDVRVEESTANTQDSLEVEYRVLLCDVCTHVPWILLPFEDHEGYPHHASLEALINSATTCAMCGIVLHAAVSNLRRSKEPPPGIRSWWKRYESVHTYQDVRSNALRRATYIKGLGPSMPTMQSDMVVEEIPIDLDELRTQVPKSMGIWLYGNYWSDPEANIQDVASQNRLMGVGARFGKSNHMFDSINNPKEWIHIRGSALSIATDEGKSLVSSMQQNLECRRPPTNPILPTRILDIFVSEDSVVLHEGHGQRGRYVAFSHSWGTSSRLMLETSNLEDLKRGMDLTSLPQTFRDAIQITKRLGIHYLWIDCLCIVQDDPLDWEKEAELYRQQNGMLPQRTNNSYLSSASLSLGYKSTVQADGPDTFHVLMPSSIDDKKGKLFFSKEWLPGSCSQLPQKAIIGSFGQSFDPLGDEPLSRRGWTLQERLLPSRLIHYAKDQMYFQCGCRIQSEDGFLFRNKMFSLESLVVQEKIPFEEHGAIGPGVSFIPRYHLELPRGRWDGGWLSLIQNYSQRKLTVDQDKLPALSGLARLLAGRTGDRYLAGLWANHLPEDLFWRVYPQEESYSDAVGGLPIRGKILGEVKRPKEYRAPSWSRASLDAPVRFLPLTYGSLVSRVVICSTTPSGVDEYGRVKAGRLVIDGPVYEIFPRIPEDKPSAHGRPVEIRFSPGDNRETSPGDLFLDFPDEPIPSPCYALFLDPGNALVLRVRQGRPEIKRDEIPGFDVERDANSISEKLVTTNSVVEVVKKRPELKGLMWQSLPNAERIGIATFSKGYKPMAREDKKEVEELDVDNLTLEDVEHVLAGESWGAITREDPRQEKSFFVKIFGLARSTEVLCKSKACAKKWWVPAKPEEHQNSQNRQLPTTIVHSD
ncbi:HET-domain-containing protein [Zopfia rhizophila CBS 207.26]|uniref:HET-domain-containing protein n=1 Tax=Zopfia rhizophila CBS 207.26 TaxID=1314779 RepID=A0A6A6DF45_9PEZI|nr:HET-domain-containing protein [Zopfia rhizophila CBS 207.26]